MLYIGIDVGGTNLKAGLVDETGNILAVERRPLDFRGPEQFAADVAQLAAAAAHKGGVAPEALEYVVVHELCHLIEFNHSQRFWRLVESRLPEYEAAKKWLKDNGEKLNI